MGDLPPELQAFAALLDAQPSPVREAFQYCLCLAMVEAGKMKLVRTLPGETTPICLFETSAGDSFAVSRPPLDAEQEAALLEALREIIDDDGLG